MHSHIQEDMLGLAESLAGKSDITHRHRCSKIAIVAKSGGDNVDPLEAVNAHSNFLPRLESKELVARPPVAVIA